MNSVTRKLLKDCYGQTRFRLACTATPAPNDHMELGNHAEFLGICEPVDMLNRYFVHDSGDTSKWRLRGHAERDFWAWVSQWAVCISKPSDIGGKDKGYKLPELRVQRHHVTPDNDAPPDGMLFNTSGISATTMHEEKRLTNSARCRKAAEIAKHTKGAVLIWCDTDYEADELKRAIPDAVDVRGSHSEEFKDAALCWFCGIGNELVFDKPSTCKTKANTSVRTTKRTEQKKSQLLLSGASKTENEEKSTWKSTESETQINSENQKNNPTSTTKRGVKNTHPTNYSGASALPIQSEEQSSSGKSSCVENTGLHSTFTMKCLSSNLEDVQSAETKPQAMQEKSDCTSTIAIELESFEDCYAQNAIHQSADSTTQLNDSNQQSDTLSRILITKPSIFGFGVNLQHCSTQIFAGLSYSFEAYYQAVRRSWRFGQTKPVSVHIIIADSDSAIESAVARKESDHAVMQSGMAQAMARSSGVEMNGDMLKQKYQPGIQIEVPGFIEGATTCK